MFSVATPILAADIQSETLELNYSSEAIENVETSESVEAVEPLELVQDYAYIENFESVEEELKNTYG